MFSADFFKGNRQKLYKTLDAHGFLIMTAHGLMQRSYDQAYTFAQEPNFWYVTGIEEPDWLFIADLQSGEEWLMVPKVSVVKQAFDGSLTANQAQKISGITSVITLNDGRDLFKKIISSKKVVYTLKPEKPKEYGAYSNPAQRNLMAKLKTAKVTDIRLPLARLRAIKQHTELAALQKAIDITCEGLQKVSQNLSQLQYEYQIEALLGYEFRKAGAFHAFDPIVAAGQNACTLHYNKATSRLEKEQFIVCDVGARYAQYPADISRTFIKGKASQRQKEVYQAVAQAQTEIIQLLVLGASVRGYLEEVQNIMHRYLVDLKLLRRTDKVDKIYKWMPHAIGHGLGLDVHDALGKPEYFAENMVITVEPGIYIPEEGIGVRIEDDILLNQSGPVVMSKAAPNAKL